MKLCVLGVLLLALTCHGSVTHCPDCPATSHSMDARETATSTATPASSSSAQPMAAAETTPVPPVASSSDQTPLASSTVATNPTSATTTTTSPGNTTTIMTAPGVSPEDSGEVVTVDSGLSSLAVDVLDQLTTRKNVLISPLSIGSLLAAVQMGARGDTGRQIAKLLGLHSSEDEVYWGQLAAALSAIHDSPAVGAEFVNAIFMDNRLVTHPDFERHLKRTQTAELVPADFISDRLAALYFINQWVSNKTHTKIVNILDSTLASDTVISLASVLYFDGAWNDQFPMKDTKPSRFRISATEVIEVNMMHHHAKALYALDTRSKHQVLGLPYKDEDFALFFILPEKHGLVGLQELRTRMPSSYVLHLLNSAYWEDVSYFVPRMILETTLQLHDALYAAGLQDLFFSTRAELQGMVSPVNGTTNLFVKNLSHSVVLHVTETGMEPPAAPPTGPHAVHTNGDDGRVEVVVDRPFLLVLQHRPTGIPVIWASVVYPMPYMPLPER